MVNIYLAADDDFSCIKPPNNARTKRLASFVCARKFTFDENPNSTVALINTPSSDVLDAGRDSESYRQPIN